ncbi:unnamed protein product [marine sediment metagenome]|uniref:Uncharacterized protein n=1 Tax=marine sediment metagenome TaxID=412755 RepID=X1PNY3_9ZZZZ
MMGAAVGDIYLESVTPPVPTQLAVIEGVAGSYTVKARVAQLC